MTPKEFHSKLTFTARDYIVVCSDPAYKVANFRTSRGRVAHDYDQPAVMRTLVLRPVSGEPEWNLHRL